MKKMKLVSFIATVLLVGFAFLAVSCSSSPAGEEQGEEQETEQQEEEEVEEEPAVEAPVIPHTLQGRDDCLMCHGENGIKPYPADHAGRTNAICTSCHQPAQ